MDDTAFSGDFLTVGVGAAVVPSYAGSDDYVFTPAPLVFGSIGGVGISPRGAGLALDFIPDGDGVSFDLGPVARMRSDRATQIKDDVVESLGELDRAIEVGGTAGIGFSGVLNPYDVVSVSGDVLWDINGAHEGMTFSPGVSYFTPLSRSMAAVLSLSAEWADEDFHDYYYRVTPAQSLVTGGVLAPFEPSGSGFTQAGATFLMAYDLNNNLADGGWALAGVVGYSRMLGDAKRTPFTSTVGSADQFFGGAGIGYTF